VEDERLYQAYVAKAFDADEYASQRYVLKEKKKNPEEEKEKMQQRLLQQVGKQEQKQAILTSVEELRTQAGADTNQPIGRRLSLFRA
jgi:hypothetical protein